MGATLLIVAAMAAAALALSGSKKKRQTREQCIVRASELINLDIVWETDAGKQSWVAKFTAAGFTKAAQCLSFEDGSDNQIACLTMLDSAIAADLRALAAPLKTKAQFAQLGDKLAADGFGEAAKCFR